MSLKSSGIKELNPEEVLKRIIFLLISVGAIFVFAFWLTFYIADFSFESLKKIENKSPVVALTQEQIDALKIQCGDINKAVRADCILDWQADNIFYCNKPEITPGDKELFLEDYPDCNIDMIMNEIYAGSFPVFAVLERKVRDGQVFGQSYTFATTYCAIARGLGLDCRVMRTKSDFSSENISGWVWRGFDYCGLVDKKYVYQNGWKCLNWFGKHWRMAARHYWPEVEISGRWEVMTKLPWRYGKNGEKELYLKDDYRDTGW